MSSWAPALMRSSSPARPSLPATGWVRSRASRPSRAERALSASTASGELRAEHLPELVEPAAGHQGLGEVGGVADRTAAQQGDGQADAEEPEAVEQLLALDGRDVHRHRLVGEPVGRQQQGVELLGRRVGQLLQGAVLRSRRVSPGLGEQPGDRHDGLAQPTDLGVDPVAGGDPLGRGPWRRGGRRRSRRPATARRWR